MLLFWGLLLCWGLLPQAQGEAQHQLFLRISKNQLETDISDLFSEYHVLDRLARIPVTGATSEGVAILYHLPFVREGLSKKSSGLDLSLVGDLLSGKSLPLLRELLQAGGLVIEDVKGPEVTLQILSDSLLQVTLRSKLYLSLQEILRLKVIKNIRIGVRLEHTGNKTKVVFEECHTPPGYLSIKVLEQMDPLLVNEALELVTSVLDEALPFLLQKIVCPLATTLLNSLLEGLLHITLPPTISGPEDFQYYVTTTEFTEEAILMKVRLVTPCSPDHRPRRPALLTPQPLPKLAQGSMADLAFGLETYNDILSCLYTSKEIRVDPQDSKTPNQSRGNVRLTISTPDPPTVHIDGHTATITQPGSLMLLAPSNTSSVSVSWNLLSKAVFSSRNQELKLQFTPNR
uniref:Lipid-binding serum glycoprotein N-terminal domain-containing protein n=1 Tax=Canis lupus familiaris TaxID=9615 RepID=A0A8P0N9R3_CANLF